MTVRSCGGEERALGPTSLAGLVARGFGVLQAYVRARTHPLRHLHRYLRLVWLAEHAEKGRMCITAANARKAQA